MGVSGQILIHNSENGVGHFYMEVKGSQRLTGTFYPILSYIIRKYYLANLMFARISFIYIYIYIVK